MSTQSLVDKIFKRARQRGCENNKDIINGNEIQKELQSSTKSKYSYALFEIWKGSKAVIL